ncbi:hypothetical protein [Abyssicoccus albus]|uniref:Uncharacterized protein n=1 Tax=Abyssicoccus albus TaxID=1817405 RepID=A0A1Q1G0T6_9BACL|nr:hypothetical protein [Abyssicoccus albus]AQL55889.1 hypothetical protein BVH56_02630 [Abyssicoccus albus]RPF58305.1 hypothetical protein EDD62_0949 [Abyssicoccus albus]
MVEDLNRNDVDEKAKYLMLEKEYLQEIIELKEKNEFYKNKAIKFEKENNKIKKDLMVRVWLKVKRVLGKILRKIKR